MAKRPTSWNPERVFSPPVELGAGGYPGNAHCRPAALLAGWTISSLSCHGNPDHPNEGLRKGVEFPRGIVLRDAKGAITWA